MKKLIAAAAFAVVAVGGAIHQPLAVEAVLDLVVADAVACPGNGKGNGNGNGRGNRR